AAFLVFVEVALRRAQGNASEVGDLVVRQAVALQPQHFHLALDVRMRVVIPVGVYRFDVFVREGELAHGRRPWCCLILLPRLNLWGFTSAGQTCTFSPRRV